MTDIRNILTPAQMRCRRLLLGATQTDIAEVAGTNSEIVRSKERASCRVQHAPHLRALSDLEEHASHIEAMLEERASDPDRWLFMFRRNDDLEECDADSFDRLRWHFLHNLMIAELWALRTEEGHNVNVIEFVAEPYERFRAENNLENDADAMQAWADFSSQGVIGLLPDERTA